MSSESSNDQCDAVIAEYKERVASSQSRIAELAARKTQGMAMAIGGALFAATLAILALRGSGWAVASVILCSIVAVLGLRMLLQARADTFAWVRRMNIYERGLARMEGRWRGTGRPGVEFAREGHAYQADLEILGEGSLFELMATTRTEVGAERLAEFLLDESSLEAAHARQEAVKELRGQTSLREEIALLGKYGFVDCKGTILREWLELPVITVAAIVPVVLLLSGFVTVALFLCGAAKIFLWVQLLPLLAPLLAGQALTALWLRDRVSARLRGMHGLRETIAVLREGSALLGRQRFNSGRLSELVTRVNDGKAVKALRLLTRLLTAVERREDVIVYGFSLWIAAGTQLVLAAERWRADHQRDLEGWLDAWAELEALSAVATYGYEHAEDEFPRLVDGRACFEAKELRHPLLNRGEAVGNDVRLNASAMFYLISGSNMAGKSTLLRAVGLNAVLAAAGAPVSARDARMSVFKICASIAVMDSRVDGRSKFLAEVERLRAAIEATKQEGPVLFLIDEILSGTNSQDRKVAAEAVLRELIMGGAVGAVSTHDLALTEIADDAELRGMNVHMQSEDADEPMGFDYRLKPGILKETNGLAIVKMLGILL